MKITSMAIVCLLLMRSSDAKNSHININHGKANSTQKLHAGLQKYIQAPLVVDFYLLYS